MESVGFVPASVDALASVAPAGLGLDPSVVVESPAVDPAASALDASDGAGVGEGEGVMSEGAAVVAAEPESPLVYCDNSWGGGLEIV